MSRVLVGVKRVIDYAVKVSFANECKGYFYITIKCNKSKPSNLS